MTDPSAMVDSSLEGVVAAATRLASVDGRRGVALIRGYRLDALAASCTFEDVAHLILRGELPDATERDVFAKTFRASCELTASEIALMGSLRAGRSAPDALAAAFMLAEDESLRTTRDAIERCTRLLGRLPSICAAAAGFTPAPATQSYAYRSLVALGSERHDPSALRAIEVLLCLESEHGLAASTFACRIAASSGSHAGVSLGAAVATLAGPRHGGATADARTLLLDAQASGDPAKFVREKHARKARLPGFGHRIYKVADPRVPPLRAAMEQMENVPLLSVAKELDRVGGELYGPKGIWANIDLYGAVLLDALGVKPEHYVAAFALGLSCGWLAHWMEQRVLGRLIRPESQYVGPAERAIPTG